MRLPRGLGMTAILGKELRSRMHRWRSILVLTAYLVILAALGLAVVQLLGMQMQYGGASQMATYGSVLFGLLSGFQLMLIVFIAPALTAGAIAGERERQTLDLLLCTRLSAFAIVAGKLIASLSYVLLLLVASLPLFTLTFFFGGVSPRQLALVFLISVATALTIGTIGLFISSVIRRGQLATVLAYVAAFALTLGIGAAGGLAALLSARGSVSPHTHWLAYLNPIAALTSAMWPGPASYGGALVGYYAGPPFTTGPAEPLWPYHLLIDAALIAILLPASMLALRPQWLRSRWRRRGGE